MPEEHGWFGGENWDENSLLQKREMQMLVVRRNTSLTPNRKEIEKGWTAFLYKPCPLLYLFYLCYCLLTLARLTGRSTTEFADEVFELVEITCGAGIIGCE